MAKKAIGMILMILGFAGIILSFEKIRTLLPITLDISKLYLTIGGIILIIIGILFSLKKGVIKETLNELPIYQGEKVVGYRRN